LATKKGVVTALLHYLGKGTVTPAGVDRSSGKTEELVHKTDFACHTRPRQHAMAAADHAHDLKASQSCRGCLHPLEAAGWADHALERTMIGLNTVIYVL
jgi:hypothetical protein